MIKKLEKKIKGFTLIELLAIIVIIGLLILVIVPAVSDVIEHSRKKTFHSSISSLVKIAQNTCAERVAFGQEKDVTYTFENGIQTTHPSNQSKLSFAGKAPHAGYLIINGDCEIRLSLSNGKYFIEKSFESTLNQPVAYDDQDLEAPYLKAPCRGMTSIVDPRDSKEYKIVEIGDQCWFAEYLDYEDPLCISNPIDHPSATGCRRNNNIVYYQFDALMNGETTEGSQGVCPTGWYVPTDDDFHALEIYYAVDECSATRIGLHGSGSESSYDCSPAGSALKHTNYFNAELVGYVIPYSGNLFNYGFDALLVSSSEYYNDYSIVRIVSESSDAISRAYTSTYNLLPLRCIKSSQ